MLSFRGLAFYTAYATYLGNCPSGKKGEGAEVSSFTIFASSTKEIQLKKFILVAIAFFMFVACGSKAPEGNVSLRIQGLGSADNVTDLMLPVGDYYFATTGTAADPTTTIVLNVHPGVDDTNPAIVTMNIDVPFADVGALAGETGAGATAASIGTGDNTVLIPFAWGATALPEGRATVDLSFEHPPTINNWSVTPGTGMVTEGDPVTVMVNVSFFGTGGTVEAQHGGDPPTTLTDLGGGIWSGSVPTNGAAYMNIDVIDSEGTLEQGMPYVTIP